MTEATQRFFCRSGFMLLCVLPTFIVGAWTLWRQTPAFAQQQRGVWQQELARTLGLRVEIGAISEPSPGKYVLTNVTLRDPDAPREQLPLARVERVDVLRNSAGLLILASEAELASADLPRLWSVMHERLVRGPELAEARVHVAVSSVALAPSTHEVQPPLRLTDLRVVLENSAAGAQARLQFRPPGASEAPVMLEVLRSRTHYPVFTEWKLDAHQAAIPSQLLTTCLPAIQELGSAATFEGFLRVISHDRGWDASADAVLRHVRLSSLVASDREGYDDIVLNNAQWRQGRLVTGQESIVLGRANVAAVALAQAVVTGDDGQVRHLLHILR